MITLTATESNFARTLREGEDRAEHIFSLEEASSMLIHPQAFTDFLCVHGVSTPALIYFAGVPSLLGDQMHLPIFLDVEDESLEGKLQQVGNFLGADPERANRMLENACAWLRRLDDEEDEALLDVLHLAYQWGERSGFDDDFPETDFVVMSRFVTVLNPLTSPDENMEAVVSRFFQSAFLASALMEYYAPAWEAGRALQEGTGGQALLFSHA